MKNNPNTELPFVTIGTETGRFSTKHPNYSVQPSHISEPLSSPLEHSTLHDQLNFGEPVHSEQLGVLAGITETDKAFTDPTVFKNKPNAITTASKTTN